MPPNSFSTALQNLLEVVGVDLRPLSVPRAGSRLRRGASLCPPPSCGPVFLFWGFWLPGFGGGQVGCGLAWPFSPAPPPPASASFPCRLWLSATLFFPPPPPPVQAGSCRGISTILTMEVHPPPPLGSPKKQRREIQNSNTAYQNQHHENPSCEQCCSVWNCTTHLPVYFLETEDYSVRIGNGGACLHYYAGKSGGAPPNTPASFCNGNQGFSLVY